MSFPVPICGLEYFITVDFEDAHYTVTYHCFMYNYIKMKSYKMHINIEILIL